MRSCEKDALMILLRRTSSTCLIFSAWGELHYGARWHYRNKHWICCGALRDLGSTSRRPFHHIFNDDINNFTFGFEHIEHFIAEQILSIFWIRYRAGLERTVSIIVHLRRICTDYIITVRAQRASLGISLSWITMHVAHERNGLCHFAIIKWI